MSGVLNRLKKKRGFPVVIDGETYYVRSPTIGELRRLDVIPADLKTGFLVGCALCADAGGEPEIPKTEDSDEAWAKRVLDELQDVPTETIRALSEGVAAIGRTGSVEGAAKN
jgi:hypothetical protein